MKTINLLLIIPVFLLFPWISWAEPASTLISELEPVQKDNTMILTETAPTTLASPRSTHFGMGYEKRMSQTERRPEMNKMRIERPHRPVRPMRPNR